MVNGQVTVNLQKDSVAIAEWYDEIYDGVNHNGYVIVTKYIQNRKNPIREPVIDGYKKFLFLDKNEMPMVALHWEKYFKRILEKYNRVNKVQFPQIPPHVCRHTFCSNMAKRGRPIYYLANRGS